MTNNEREPREFWLSVRVDPHFYDCKVGIGQSIYGFNYPVKPEDICAKKEDLLHVIEKSYADKLEAENKRLKFELEAKQRPLGEQVLELTLSNQRLRAALEGAIEGFIVCGERGNEAVKNHAMNEIDEARRALSGEKK